MSKRTYLLKLCTALVTAVCLADLSAPAVAQLAPTRPGYAIQYQIDDAWVGPIGLLGAAELMAGSFQYDASFNSLLQVRTVGLNAGPVSAPLYTQPLLDPPAAGTFAGSAIATDGSHVLTAQTGYPASPEGLFPGRLLLTDLTDASTSSLDVPGNWDMEVAGGAFYVTAAAGAATGLADNGYSGLYQLARTGGTLTGLNLIVDTGAPSGAVAADGDGNLVFSLGGNSALLQGGLNDLYRLTADQVAVGVAAGPLAGLSSSAADRLITGSVLGAAAQPFLGSLVPEDGSVFASLSDVVFGPEGTLIVGLSGYLYDDQFNFTGVAGLGLLLDVTDQGGDFSATVRDILYTNATDGGGSLAFRASDNTLWVSTDGHLYGLAVPEPATLLLFLCTLGLLRRRRA